MSSSSTGRTAPGMPSLGSPGRAVLHLHDVQWQLPDGRPLWREPLHLSIGRERLGIVGRNGVGKSVLAQILAGRMPSSGTAWRSGRVHLVAPPLQPADGCTISEAMGLGAILEAVERLSAGLATPADLLLVDGRWDVRARMAQALAEAGLRGLRLNDPITGLSVGRHGARQGDPHALAAAQPGDGMFAPAWRRPWRRPACAAFG